MIFQENTSTLLRWYMWHSGERNTGTRVRERVINLDHRPILKIWEVQNGISSGTTPVSLSRHGNTYGGFFKLRQGSYMRNCRSWRNQEAVSHWTPPPSILGLGLEAFPHLQQLLLHVILKVLNI
jgi:hypothetical protein